ncbi:MAG: 2,4-dihydroxyhept-2-ene-1,7-dioic acid aldolase [Opitutaceae bacterium]|mgnify:CR=1 FL=1|nr:2,4-dihydroxyhept-2-ene-1,7-dioic acid aldolase [Opitutaceae bacterium]|tara:strand:- start:1574 stop:2344 length:771 start_codon:yes stop_codon:yes gene_type:complete
MDAIRKRLLNGETLVGSWINSGSTIIAELMAAAGFDFLCIDAEHSAVDLPQVQALFQAMHSGNPNCANVVRLHGVDYSLVKRYLDAGAQGVIAPLVMSKADAELLIEASKYQPLGNRGVGFCRGNQYGLNVEEKVKTANEDIFVAVQIEHVDAVDCIDEILDVEGIDAVFVGPYDLSASMGLTAQFEHPDYIAARTRVLDACKRSGIAPGIHVVPPEPAMFLDQQKEGYRLMAYSLDITMVLEACKNGLSKIRAAI